MKRYHLTNKNFLLYTAQHYENPHCQDVEEFLDDLKRIKYIKKLISRYIESGEIKERLILNHIIVLNNLFGSEATVNILYLKMKDYFKYIKPFLVLLNILPDKLYNIGNEELINTSLIPLDQHIIDCLRKI